MADKPGETHADLTPPAQRQTVADTKRQEGKAEKRAAARDKQTAADREASLKRDQAVVDAVYAASRDEDGDPIPLGGDGEIARTSPPGIHVVSGKP